MITQIGEKIDINQLINQGTKLYQRKSYKGGYYKIHPDGVDIPATHNPYKHWKELNEDEKFMGTINPSDVSGDIIVTRIYKSEARIEFLVNCDRVEFDQYGNKNILGKYQIMEVLKIKKCDLSKLLPIGRIDTKLINVANGYWETAK